MALRFIDSFDHYATADITAKWTSRTGATINSGAGRRSTSSLRTTLNLQYVIKTLDSQATWIVGFSFSFSALPSSTADIFSLLDAGTNQVELRLLADGTLRVTRNGTTLATGTASLSANTSYFIEFKVTINNTTGAYEVRVNGSSTNHPSGTGANTRNTANNSANQLRLGCNAVVSAGTSCDYDDFYACDGTGSSPHNDFLGDVRIDCYLPNGNGNSSQLTGSDGNSTDNYLLVDDSSQDGDSTYAQTGTSGNKDTYAFADMTHTPTNIFGLQANMTAKKDDSGTRSIASVIRSGGSDTDGTTQALGTSYADYLQISTTDPNTLAAWTKTGYNAAEFGAKCAA